MTFSELADFYISIQGKRRKIEKAIGYIPSSLKGIWVKWRKGKGQKVRGPDDQQEKQNNHRIYIFDNSLILKYLIKIKSKVSQVKKKV